MRCINFISCILLLLCFAASCGGGEASRRMDLADSLMEENPDSALAILCSVDSQSLGSEEARARYTLLTTQARVKTDLLDLSDTTALPVLEYYDNHGPEFDRMRAAFYQANIYNAIGDMIQEIRHLSAAEDIALKISDEYWLAKIYEAKADLYNKNGYRSSSIVFRLKAINNYFLANKKLNALYSQCDLANDYNNLGQYDKAINILDSLESNEPMILESPGLHAYFLNYLGIAYYDIAEYRKADSCHKFRDSYDLGYFEYYGAKRWRALISVANNDDTADSLLKVYSDNLLSVGDSALYYKALSDLSAKQNKIQLSKQYLDTTLTFLNRDTETFFKNSIFTEEYEIEIEKKLKTEIEKFKLWMLVSALISVVIILIIYYRIRIGFMRKKMDLSIDVINTALNKEIEANNNLREEIIESQKSNFDALGIQNLYRGQIRQLVNICQRYYEATSTRQKKHEYNDVLLLLQKIGEPKSLSLLRTQFNNIYPGLDTLLKKEYESKYSDSIPTLLLLLSGLTPAIISLILGEDVQTIYSRRRRFTERLSNSAISSKDLILSALSK